MVGPCELDMCSMLTEVGLYEQQDSNQVEHNLRGKFITDAEGRYSFYCLRPTPYPVSTHEAHGLCDDHQHSNNHQVPNDGPAGKLLELMDRHPFRPAHIHLIVRILASIVLTDD